MTSLDESWWARVLGGPGGELHNASSSERYVVLPRASEPRVVVDHDDSQALRDAVERYVDNRTSARGARSIAGGAAAVLARRRPTWSVAASGPTLREYLSEVLGVEVRLSVAVGPPRPNLKPVVRCYSKNRLVAVAKLGPDPHTAELVDNDALWLDEMIASPLSGVETPQLFHHGRYGDSAILVMAALDLESERSMGLDEVPNEVIQEFSQRYAEPRTLLDETWFPELMARVDRQDLASVAAQVAQVRRDPMLLDLAVTAWHGDWSPWNMGQLKNGKLCVWDWERAAVGTPAGFDLLHLHFQYGDGLDAATDALIGIGVPAKHHRLIKMLYLFELCARHGEADVISGEKHARVLAELDRVRELATT